MSALFIRKAAHSSNLQLSSQSPISRIEQPRLSAGAAQTSRELEPPEQALQVCEAPELGQQAHTEAPDAGKGRDDSHDHEFRHGRSRG
jgi:hypothetical protein